MQDEVKVTQAARDAAEEFMNAHGWLCEEEWTHLYGADQEVIVKFFAKFEQSIRQQAERETLARMEWRDIESAPKDRYFLACVTPERSEEKLLKAIFGDDHQIPDNRGIIVARWRPKQRKGRVFMSVTGASFWATHWMELPDVPSFKEKDFPRDY